MHTPSLHYVRLLLAGSLVFALQCVGVAVSRSFLTSDSEPSDEFGGHGFVVFTSEPRPDNERHMATCQAFLRSFPDLVDYAAADPAELMVMYWPLDVGRIDPGDDRDCSFLLDRYDFARANKLAADWGFSGSAGPILLGLADGVEGGLILDLSDFLTEDVIRGFRIWREHVSRDASAWRDGFTMTVIREAFRNLIQAYGATIIRTIEA